MIAFLRRRPPSLLLRLLVLAVIALGTAGGALASALGELHALSHADHPSATHDPVLEVDTGCGRTPRLIKGTKREKSG